MNLQRLIGKVRQSLPLFQCNRQNAIGLNTYMDESASQHSQCQTKHNIRQTRMSEMMQYVIHLHTRSKHQHHNSFAHCMPYCNIDSSVLSQYIYRCSTDTNDANDNYDILRCLRIAMTMKNYTFQFECAPFCRTVSYSQKVETEMNIDAEREHAKS